MNLPKKIENTNKTKQKINTAERGTDDFWNDCEE
jgi:hypothetical protein